VSLFTKPGQGQVGFGNRDELHKSGAQRHIFDALMVPSHIPFMAASATSFKNNLTELALLTAVTTILSLLYHRGFERPGRLCTAEGLIAKLLFVYGAAQLLQAPTSQLFLVELLLLILTMTCFFLTNLYKQLYDRLHIGMHLIPAVWCFVVASFHQPLFRL
jgi:hypothetical protein